MNVGPMIRARRMQLHLSLTALAKRSELSVPFLSQVERGHSGLTLVSLVKVAGALGVSVNYFLNSEEADMPIQQAGSQHFFTLSESKMRIARVGTGAADRTLEPLLVIFPPHYETESLNHAGEEFIYVVCGQIAVTLDKQQYLLSIGDTAHFKSANRHKWHNPTDGESQMLWVGTPRLF